MCKDTDESRYRAYASLRVTGPETMIAAQRDLERRVFLGGISWDTYQSLRNADENYHLRMTYDHGALEIVSPSRRTL